jgi:uncharacterized membrane protein YedE/YeeE
MDASAEPWSWWWAALGLAGAAALSLLWTRQRLGVSGCIELVVGARPRSDGAEPGVDRVGAGMLLAGLVLGGVLAAGPALQPSPDGAWAAFFGGGASAWAAALGGSLLVGFGTRLSGGCTSGHGLVGCALFSVRSLVATGAFFGTAIAASLALDLLGGAR